MALPHPVPPRRVSVTAVTVLIGLVLVLACALWAVVAQVAVTPACELPTPPPDANYLRCS